MRRTIEPRAQPVTSAPDASGYLLGTRSPVLAAPLVDDPVGEFGSAP